MTFDCGIASLSVLTGRSYGDVAKVARKLYPKVDPQKYGLFNKEVVAVARELGLRMTQERKRAVDLTDHGVLRVRWNDGRRKNAAPHFVAIRDGVVLCHENGMATWEDYRTKFDCRPCTLLKVTN